MITPEEFRQAVRSEVRENEIQTAQGCVDGMIDPETREPAFGVFLNTIRAIPDYLTVIIRQYSPRIGDVVQSNVLVRMARTVGLVGSTTRTPEYYRQVREHVPSVDDQLRNFHQGVELLVQNDSREGVMDIRFGIRVRVPTLFDDGTDVDDQIGGRDVLVSVSLREVAERMGLSYPAQELVIRGFEQYGESGGDVMALIGEWLADGTTYDYLQHRDETHFTRENYQVAAINLMRAVFRQVIQDAAQQCIEVSDQSVDDFNVRFEAQGVTRRRLFDGLPEEVRVAMVRGVIGVTIAELGQGLYFGVDDAHMMERSRTQAGARFLSFFDIIHRENRGDIADTINREFRYHRIWALVRDSAQDTVDPRISIDATLMQQFPGVMTEQHMQWPILTSMVLRLSIFDRVAEEVRREREAALAQGDGFDEADIQDILREALRRYVHVMDDMLYLQNALLSLHPNRDQFLPIIHPSQGVFSVPIEDYLDPQRIFLHGHITQHATPEFIMEFVLGMQIFPPEDE